LIEILKSKRGEGYIDVVVVVLVAMMVIAMAVKVYPVFVVKSDLNTFANELARVAEIEGRIGSETTAKKNELRASLGIDPTVNWSTSGNIDLNEEFSVVLTLPVDIGFFEFGSFPITLTAKATGRSEVYHK
jgi:Tfp pilus assembly protein PilE